MKRHLMLVVGLIVVGGFLFGAASEAAAKPELIGAAKCKSCHRKIGDPYKIWQGTAHSGAYETLASEESKKIAADMGLGDPQKEEACLKCHVSRVFLGNAPVDAKGKYDDSEGVGCEACHGPGSDYKSKKTMQDSAAAKAAGLIMDKSEAACTKCHNEESPTFKGFDFAARWEEIKHPVTEKE